MKLLRGYTLSVSLSLCICFGVLALLVPGAATPANAGLAALPLVLGLLAMAFKKQQKPAAILVCVAFAACFFGAAVIFFAKDVVLFARMTPLGTIIAALDALLLLIFAIALPKSKPNGMFGIRTQQVTAYPALWPRVHNMAGWISGFFVLPAVLLIFYFEEGAKLGLTAANIFAFLGVSAVMTQLVTRKDIKCLQALEEHQKRQAQTLEQGYTVHK